MKKMIFGLMTMGAIFFSSQNIQAQEDKEQEVEVETTVETEVTVQEDFTDLDVMQLPQPVKDAIMTDYNGAVASQAWVKTEGDQKIYKIDIDVKGETETAFADQDGNWLEMEDEGDE
ncbi:MAG: hypothetical protein ABGW97_09955 [Christiangramia sp.]|uniref:hypothetical protein n=1 Tax=Christiangramia sp. TaxID=1931228 RepID=UPI0032423475